MMTDAAAWLVLLPLAWAAVAFVVGPGRGARLAIAGLAVQWWLAWQLATAPAGHRLAVGGWGAPLGIDLVADGLSVAMLLLAQTLALPLAVYARAYFSGDARTAPWFWPLLGFAVAGLNALFLSEDLFNLYVTLEVVGLSAVCLVAAGGERPLGAALRYLFATLLGSGAYLLGVALIYGACGTVSIAALTPLFASATPHLAYVAGLAGGLMLAGLMLKTALFPFHYWLPPAHGDAPAPVSALLSALVVKASFYLILRLWLGPFAPFAGAVAWLPAALGGLAVLWGSYRAICARRLKILIAYSTVAQLGYLFLVFPLLSEPGAVHASMMQVVAHGLAKAAMFAAAGVVIHATGQDSVAALAGAAHRLPLTLFAFGLAGMTLMGLPPSAGFLAKWLLIDAALAQGHWEIVVVVLAGSLLAAAYVFRLLRPAFLATPDAAPCAAVPRTLQWIALALAAASVLLGLRGVELVQLLERAS